MTGIEKLRWVGFNAEQINRLMEVKRRYENGEFKDREAEDKDR